MESEIKYSIVEETYHCDDKSRRSFGIVAYDVDDTTVLAAEHDVSADIVEICALAKKCNELKLSTEHLEDVVNDFLAQ